jgi:pyrroline-5-carboxylate reductase
MIKVGFIGSGNMGSALAKAATFASGTSVFLYDKCEDKAASVASSIGAKALPLDRLVSECDFIFLAVKPNIIPAVAAEILPMLKSRKNFTLVSMAAGVSLEKLNSLFEAASAPIIRIMPNTPASVGFGMTLWCKNALVSDKAASDFACVMEKAGALDAIDEKLIDAASAISGCGPAFVYMFIEALADGGVECGLPRDKALRYAAETLVGAAEMVKQTGIHPEELKDAVCSPGGSTIAGVHALEEGSFRATAASAVLASYKKTLTLGK